MPKLSSLLAEKAKADVQLGGSTLQVVLYVMLRERFSDAEWTVILAMPGREYLTKTLSPGYLCRGDLVDDFDQPLPMTAEAIERHRRDQLGVGLSKTPILLGRQLRPRVVTSS